MKTKNLIILVVMILLGLGISYGLTVTQVIDNSVAYIKKMIFTPDGTDNSQSTVVIDGTKGDVSMSGGLVVGKDAKIENQLTASGLNVTNSLSTKDLNVSNNAIITGNVGIGTTDPQAKLDVNAGFRSAFSFKGERGKDYNNDGFEDYDEGALYTTYGDIRKGSPTLHYEEYDDPLIILGRQTKNKDSKDAIISMYNGNVGIGTTDPKAKLDVRDMSDAGSWVTTHFEGNNSITSHFIFQNQNLSGNAVVQVRGKEGTYNGDAPYLDIGVSNKDKKAFIGGNIGSITINNNVGIGTTNPQAKLDVNGNLEATNGYGDKIGLGGDAYGDDSEVYIESPEDRNTVAFWNKTLKKTANIRAENGIFNGFISTLGLTVTNNAIISGNVGIGTTDPQAKLDVNGDIQSKGDIKVGYINPKNTGSFPGYGSFLRFYGGPAGTARNSDNSDPTWIARYNVSTDHTELRINVGDNYVGDDAVNITSKNGSKSLMYINNNGNVGIGTTNPQAKLDVNGDIAINGLKTIQMKTQTIRLKGDIKHYYPVIIHFDGPNFYNKITITSKPRGQLTNTPNAFGNKCNHGNCYDYSHETNIFINYEGLTNNRGAGNHFLKKDWFDDTHDVKNCRLTIAGRALMCYMAGDRHYSFHGTFSSIDVYYTPGDHRLSCHYNRGSCGDYNNKGNGKGPKSQWLDYHTVYSR